MKSLLQNVISIFNQGAGLVSFHMNKCATDVIVTGYSSSLCDKPWRVSPFRLNHRQAGILYADIADYSRLTEQDEEGTHIQLVEAMKIMKTHVAVNGGRIAHFAGDAILVEFKDADSALHCAINVQLAARQWNANLNLDQQVLFRIGVNFGDVITDHGDIYGNAVNLTARLESLASSGGICVSEAVRRKLADQPSFKFVAMGKQYVKNISEPVDSFWIEMDAQQVVDKDLNCAVKVSAVSS